MPTNRDIIQRIEELEKELKDLRLTLTERETEDRVERGNDDFQVGEYVKVLNPKIGQESIAKVVKINDQTGYYTLSGKRFRRQIVRKKKNIGKLN